MRASAALDAALPETTVRQPSPTCVWAPTRSTPPSSSPSRRVARPPRRELLDTISAAITGVGIRVLKRLHTRQVEHAGQWTDIDTGDSGPTYPFRDSIAAAESVTAVASSPPAALTSSTSST